MKNLRRNYIKKFPIETVKWDKGKIKIIDQSKLPERLVYRYCRNVKEAWWAIKKLQVRGAPALGVMAGYSVVLGLRNNKFKSFSELDKKLKAVTKYLSTARPTAVNLFWALERIKKVVIQNKGKGSEYIKKMLLKEANKILAEDRLMCQRIGEYGADLLKSNMNVLTHCNAGALATGGIGTALGIIYTAHHLGKKIKVYADETRPLLQGARLTAWELKKAGIEVTLICDNMAATLMQQKKIDCVIVGADRIAANGDTANKIGTYNLAVLAKEHKIPFYVAAPSSTFDFKIKSGKEIPIEERGGNEVKKIGKCLIAPSKVKVYNPAFDVTPHRYIRAIITEYGIARRPFRKNLKKTIEHSNG